MVLLQAIQASGGLSAITQSGPGQGGPIQRVRGLQRCLDGGHHPQRLARKGWPGRSGSVGAHSDDKLAGGRRGGGEGEAVAPLLKPRDPHLASGEQRKKAGQAPRHL